MLVRAPGQRQPRCPIGMVVDPVLVLEANAQPDHKVRFHPPIVLEERRAVEEQHAHQRVVDHGGGILRRLRGLIVGDGVEGVRSVAPGCGVVRVPVGTRTRAESERVITSRRRRIVLQLEDVLVVLDHPGAVASVSESTGNSHRRGKVNRRFDCCARAATGNAPR